MNKIISSKSSSHHIATLQSMRFVFCMQIFICHYFSNLGFHGFDYGGDAGVSFFFILSGFVLSIGCGTRVEEGTFHYVQFLRKTPCKNISTSFDYTHHSLMYELCSWSEIRCHKDISAYFYASRVYSIRRHAEIWHRTFMVSWSIVLLLFVVSFSLQTIDSITQQSVRRTINDIYTISTCHRVMLQQLCNR